MSVSAPLPLSLVQMGLVEKVAEVAQNQPLVQQQVTQEEAARKLQQKQIDPTDPALQGSQVDTKGNREKDHQQMRKKKKKEKEQDAPEASKPDSPTAGLLVNIKI